MTATPTISVIMSVYNTPESWLKEAIDSILNQTYSNFEFIIINDGSTNNVEDVILSYKDPRIKYHKQENKGLATSLNVGLSLATGTYIARMDADDISMPQRFEKQLAFLASHPDVSIVGTAHEYFPNGHVAYMPPNPKFIDFLKANAIGHPTVMFRRADFDKYNLYYDPAYRCEDYELWSRAVRVLKFANLQEVLLKYRWHGKNLSLSSDIFEFHVKKVQKNILDSLTSDISLQSKILNCLWPPHKTNFLEKIFSITNSSDKLYKVITLLGFEMKFKRNS